MLRLAMAISATDASGAQGVRGSCCRAPVPRGPAVTSSAARACMRLLRAHFQRFPAPLRPPLIAGPCALQMHAGQPATPTPQAPKEPAPPQQPAPASGADTAGGGMGGLLRALRSQLSIGAAAAASAAAGLPICTTCGKPAGCDGTPVLQANGKSYHAACFVCAGCHKVLQRRGHPAEPGNALKPAPCWKNPKPLCKGALRGPCLPCVECFRDRTGHPRLRSNALPCTHPGTPARAGPNAAAR
jgi:hypothetical protein